MRQRWGTLVAAVISGAVAALVVVSWAGSRLSDAQVAAPPVAAGPEIRSFRSAAEELRLRALEARVGKLAVASREAGQETAGSGAEPAPATQPTREEADKALRADTEAALARFHAEPSGNIFSSNAPAKLSPSLTELAQTNKASIGAVSCRNTMCVARVRWGSYDQATGAYQDFLHNPLGGVNCARRIVLHPPADGARALPYEADLILTECAFDDS